VHVGHQVEEELSCLIPRFEQAVGCVPQDLAYGRPSK
jgi:hypothetical protein